MDIFDDNYTSTFGTKISKKIILIKKADNNLSLTLSIWDVIGMKNFKNINKMAFEGARGALLVCDFTKKTVINKCSHLDLTIKKGNM